MESNGGDYGFSMHHKTRSPDDIDDETQATAKAGEYVRELLSEKLTLDPGKHANVMKLLDQEIQKVQSTGRASPKDLKFVDIYREKPIKVTVKVLVPVREHPKFNFVGKLLGPKGNSMKRLQEETMCKMAVLGRGSMKDRQKEEELRKSLDPKYSHLMDDLHVEISALGPPAEAYARIAFALAEVRKYLIPDSNDNIRQEQMREMEIMVGSEPPLDNLRIRRNVLPRAAPPPMSRMMPLMVPASRGPMVAPRVMPAKTKILSILDRARIAMEESYGYEEQFEAGEANYDYGAAAPPNKPFNPPNLYGGDYEAPGFFRDNSNYGGLRGSFNYRTFQNRGGPRKKRGGT